MPWWWLRVAPADTSASLAARLMRAQRVIVSSTEGAQRKKKVK